jgi:hypothetical protein
MCTECGNNSIRAIEQVCQVVGAPKPINFKRKFLLATDDIKAGMKFSDE